MTSSSHRIPAVAALVVCVFGLVGCDSGERDAGSSDPGGSTLAPEISVTIPPQRLTPFCQGMIDLTDRLLNDPPDDPQAEIISVYESLVEVVPPQIEQEFLTVLARLQNGEPATTTIAATTAAPSTTALTTAVDPNVTEPTTLFADEGYDPDEDPALRVNEYVQFACRDAVNNPGPAATQPGQTVAP